ncbi:MAG: ATP-binding protein [Janthinobacterium lividum]
MVQYLRKETTWSVLAETYRSDTGAVVTVAQVLWVRGKSTTPTDVRRRYLLLERALDLGELDAFAQSDFDVRLLKRTIPELNVQEDFAPYEERFRRLLGIDHSTAMRLLHKTQSLKNVGDLNAFLREYMLQEPETFALAEKLVDGFNELNEAHRAVVTARDQQAVLEPASEAHEQLLAAEKSLRELGVLSLHIEPYVVQCKETLLESAIESAKTRRAGLETELKQKTQKEEDAQRYLGLLREKRNDQGGRILEQLQADLKQAERQRTHRTEKREQVQQHWQVLGWAAPTTGIAFVELQQRAQVHLETLTAKQETLSEERDGLKRQQHRLGEELQTLRREVEVMETKRSNIPSMLLTTRETLAKAIDVEEHDLPFAGELLEVKASDREWRGAIERVLNGFAQSLLVDEKHYHKVSQYVNQTRIDHRLVYLRMTPHANTPVRPEAESLYHKLEFAKNASQTGWVKEELIARFNYLCADNLDVFRQATRAVTREGQIKHNASRHEKNDRFSVNDSRQWVLGFDNSAKIALLKEDAQQIALQLVEVDANVKQLESSRRDFDDQVRHAQALQYFQWDDIDVASMLALISTLQKQFEAEKAARPNLEQINADIVQQDRVCRQLLDDIGAIKGKLHTANAEVDGLQLALENLSSAMLATELPNAMKVELEARFDAVGKALTLETLPEIHRLADKQLEKERSQLESHRTTQKTFIEAQFGHFVREWPAEAGGLDATLASAEDFFHKLRKIVEDGLPRYVERFRTLLREHSDQNLTLLATKLDQERKAIREGMELVNVSLATAPFNPGTHLVIDTEDRQLEDVRQLKQDLRDALSHAFDGAQDEDEQRFQKLNVLVKRLSSSETVDRNWRNLVLDVRQHVDFIAREMDADGVEVERYRGGSGKSGGQRQKLTSTCLAAALRYQLGGRDRAKPQFATVVMDEAFDKADAAFTEAAMNIFKTFGFQMVIATPLKSVMTLEPFIGGACFVDISDRKFSRVTLIPYDRQEKKLLLKSDVTSEAANEVIAA